MCDVSATTGISYATFDQKARKITEQQSTIRKDDATYPKQWEHQPFRKTQLISKTKTLHKKKIGQSYIKKPPEVKGEKLYTVTAYRLSGRCN